MVHYGPLPPAANVLKLQYQGKVGNENWAMIHHCAWSGTTPVTAALDAICAALAAPFTAHLIAVWNDATTLATITATDLTSDTGAQGTAAPALVGTGGGNLVPGSAAVLINFPSSYRYRGGHPRCYLPPFEDSGLTNANTWASSYITNANSFMTALQTLYNSTSSGGTSLAGQCAVSYFNKALNPTPPYLRSSALIMPIANGAYTAEAQVASQRRRIGRK
jgi:hypothetical protein